MAGDWECLTLGNLGRVVTGKTPLTSVEGNFGGRIPFITPSDMDGRKTISTTARFLTQAGAASVKGSVIPAGAIMVSCIGSDMGKVVVAGCECVTNQQINSIVVDDRFSSEFVYYSLTTRKDEIRHQAAGGSAVPILNKGEFSRMEITLPPFAEQKAVAAVLGALDDKIELNRRMNATLEAMARALFQSWFVDFDPVRAKLDGRPPAALDPATAALFPDSFQDSTVGHIPHGWKVGVLDELTKFVIGGDWGATEPTDDETVSCYCIRGADIPSLQSGGVGKMPTRFLKPSSVEKRQLADGDLAIEISGGSPTQCTGRPVLASAALLQSLGQPLVASNFCRIVKLKSPALSKFVYLWLRRLYDAGELFQFETGTTGIKNFAFVIFSERYPLVVPDLRVAEAFDRAVSPFFARIQANSQESRTLATLRDTLLPKLLSGELSVAQLQN